MLIERRKADREKMAEAVIFLAASFGCATSVEIYNREIRVDIELGQARIGLDFDGDSAQPNVFCMPWNTTLNSEAKFSDAFGRAVGASVNPHHRRKCMGFAEGFDSLLSCLRVALECVASGDAFED